MLNLPFIRNVKLIFPVVLIFALTANISRADPAVEKEVVKIGVIAPFTGGLAARGQDIARLLEIIKEHLEQPSFAYQYQFIIEDGKCGAGNAPTLSANKLINIDKVKFLITACSGETLQVGPLAERNKVVSIAVMSLHPDIKALGDYIFRTFVDIEHSIKGFADYMGSACSGKVAILTEENAFTFGMRDLFLKRSGENVVFADDFAADLADFSTLLATINIKGAECVFFNAMSEATLANMVNQIKRMRFKQNIFAYHLPEAASFRKLTGKNSNSLYFIGTPDLKDSAPAFRAAFSEYMKRYPEGPSDVFVARTTYDGIFSIIDGVEAVGPNPEKVKDFLYSYSAEGALGTVEYDSNGDIKDLHYVLKRVREDGTSEIIKSLVTTD
jgi:branched-chain amino acid transport system substrate-binding protein